MSDLPPDCLDPLPPFTNVGVDTLLPWTILSRKTCGGYANSKALGYSFRLSRDKSCSHRADRRDELRMQLGGSPLSEVLSNCFVQTVEPISLVQ